MEFLVVLERGKTSYLRRLCAQTCPVAWPSGFSPPRPETDPRRNLASYGSGAMRRCWRADSLQRRQRARSSRSRRHNKARIPASCDVLLMSIHFDLQRYAHENVNQIISARRASTQERRIHEQH